MGAINKKFLKAFQEDHAVLGRAFADLSRCLRGNDAAGAYVVARRLQDVAGAHIAFEENDFYPALTPFLGEAAIQHMRREHGHGVDVIRVLLDPPPMHRWTGC